MSFESFERYNVPAASFDADMFEKIRERIARGQFLEEYEHLTQERSTRLFMKRRLEPSEVSKINAGETMTSARDAEKFRAKLCDIAVVESSEKLIDLQHVNELFDLRWTFSDKPYHPACGEWAGKSRLMWARQQLGRRLVIMTSDLLDCGFGIHFEDAFRPTGVQEGLFRRRYTMARQDQPQWTDAECLLEAQSKTAFTPRFAAHKAGAAVDVRVKDLTSGTLLDIGHDYPDGGEIVRLDSPFVTQEQWQNRKLLQAVARRAGLSMYPFEDWHLCLGDVTAVAAEDSGSSGVATYGPIKDFDSATGKIISVYEQDELDSVFAVD